MALLYRSLTIDAIWELLEGDAAFTALVKATRRVKDTPEGWLRNLMLRAVGDFPIVRVEMGDNFGGQGPSFTTFANEGESPTADWNEERTAEFKISVIYESAGFDRQDELEMVLIEALESGGRNLGYSPIRVWGPWKARRNVTAQVGTNETPRPTTQIILPVTYLFTGTQLQP